MKIETTSTDHSFRLFIEDNDETGLLNIEQKGDNRADVCAAALKRIDKMRGKLNRMEEAVLDIKNNV